MLLVDMAKRSRRLYEKETIRASGREQIVAAAMAACEHELESTRARKRLRVQQLRKDHDQLKKDKEMAKAVARELENEKRRRAEERAADKRRQEIEDASLHLDTAMFSPNVCHNATARKNRWAAFKRVMELAPACTTSTTAEEFQNMERDWGKWDAALHHAAQVGQPKNSEAFAIKYMRLVKRMLEKINSENTSAIWEWWKNEKATKVPNADLILSPAPATGGSSLSSFIAPSVSV